MTTGIILFLWSFISLPWMTMTSSYKCLPVNKFPSKLSNNEKWKDPNSHSTNVCDSLRSLNPRPRNHSLPGDASCHHRLLLAPSSLSLSLAQRMLGVEARSRAKILFLWNTHIENFSYILLFRFDLVFYTTFYLLKCFTYNVNVWLIVYNFLFTVSQRLMLQQFSMSSWSPSLTGSPPHPEVSALGFLLPLSPDPGAATEMNLLRTILGLSLVLCRVTKSTMVTRLRRPVV